MKRSVSASVQFVLLALASLVSVLLVSPPALAQSQHQLVRRLVVFPVQAPVEFSAFAEDAWWQAREKLASGRRFLVASKQFLIKNDVFQPRSVLQPADAVILGKLLDAHALVTLRLSDDRTLAMTVYDGGNGATLWMRTLPLHPSLTVQDQLSGLVKRIVDDFSASIPYQGFTVVDSINNSVVYEKGDIKLVQVDLGSATGAQIGDTVQWITLSATNSAPLFQGGAKMTVFAEGQIVRIEQGIATVEILRASKDQSSNLAQSLEQNLVEHSLVRVPREAERLFNQLALSGEIRPTIPVELIAPERDPMRELERERKPLVATLSIVVSLVAFFLLAF